MNIEIERKFLVKNLSYKSESFEKKYIKQGYLNSDKNRTVRIRVSNNTGFITIKGKSSKNGTSRFEWEKEIPVTCNHISTVCKAILPSFYLSFSHK